MPAGGGGEGKQMFVIYHNCSLALGWLSLYYNTVYQ